MTTESSASIESAELFDRKRIRLGAEGKEFIGLERAVEMLIRADAQGSLPADTVDLEGVTHMSGAFAREYFGSIADMCQVCGVDRLRVTNASDSVRRTFENIRDGRAGCEIIDIVEPATDAEAA